MKLIVFDIDGTLLVKGKRTIPSSASEALKQLKQNGYTLVIASGRSYSAIDQNVLSTVKFDYIIASNGASITDKYGNYEVIDPIDHQTIQRLFKDAQRFNGALEICYYQGVEILFGEEKIKEMAVYFLGEKGFQNIYNLDVKGEPLNGKSYITSDTMDYFQEQYPLLAFTTTGYGNIYDVVVKTQSKGKALQVLSQRLNINRADIIAFGDDENDLDMIQYAGIGVAMGNASPSLKESADYITSDIEEDGIYNALKRFKLL